MTAPEALSFDLFGTLVTAEQPDDPAASIATALERRDVSVPGEWASVYREPHIETDPGAEVSLPVHVAAALECCGAMPERAGVDAHELISDAVRAAFEPRIRTRSGAVEAVTAARAHGPVGVLSNCSVPGLADLSIARSDLESDSFDAVVTSVDCGWRKPDRRAFAAIANRLGVRVSSLTHVGDDPRSDGGVDAVGGRAVLLGEVPLLALPAWLEGR